MSDYTPTTDEVRAMYVTGTPPHRVTVPQGNAEFDAWIAQHDAEVREAALNAAADAVPPSTPPLGGDLAISEPVRMRFQQWLRARAGGVA